MKALMHFEFATASRIVFGSGKLTDIPSIAAPYGRRALVVTGKQSSRAHGLIAALQSAQFETETFAVAGEPTVDLVRTGAQLAQKFEMVIGFGGGSAIDAAKAIAAIAPNSGEPLDYLEVVGRGQTLIKTPLPFLAVPTTAGTGAEVTRNAVLDSTEHGIKASLRHQSLLAKAAIVDPELTVDMPPAITAQTGLDALTQLIEAFVSCRANRFTDLFCLEGISNIGPNLLRAFRNGSDLAAREAMSWGSLLSGLALANAGLGAVHGFAGPLGGLLHAPHGALCAAMLPSAISTNIHALRTRLPKHPALDRYRHIASILSGQAKADAEHAGEWVSNLCRSLDIRPLSHYGLHSTQISSLVVSARKSSSMKGNPLELTDEELAGLLENSLN
jgi:alcohol dehydrogenase class IV